MNNITYTLKDTHKQKNNFKKILDNVYCIFEDDENMALITHYNLNFLKKELVFIAKYYNISTRKKTKTDLINIIIDFEKNNENFFIVEERKRLWMYMKELKEDRFLKNFIIFK